MRLLALGVGGMVVAAAAGYAVVRFEEARAAAGAPPLAAVASTRAAATTLAQASQVEVPNLAGVSLAQARALASVAGLGLSVTVDRSAPADPGQSVTAQSPAAGTLLSSGATLTVTVPPAGTVPIRKHGKGPFVVVIDPGHQSHGDPTPEPVGPGAQVTQAAATAGSSGVSTSIPESEIDLLIAINVQQRLESQGLKVLLTRTTNDVDLSDAARAAVANSAKADLFVHLHADSSANASDTGVATYFPASNRWTAPIAAASHLAAAQVQAGLVTATGAGDDGIAARDIADFNWARVPTVFVQCGYQSNPVEDRLLASSAYQDALSQGLEDGILRYLGGRSTP